MAVSVPYRGATFLNEVFKYYKKKNKPVSVPYRGATFLNSLSMKAGDGMEMVFPSPIGELHFSILFLYFLIIFFFGFRPLSGSYISQYFAWFNHPFSIVSVPYRGATFLNGTKRPTVDSFTKEQFPSPIGELHFSIYIPFLVLFLFSSFRPLSGSYISQ